MTLHLICLPSLSSIVTVAWFEPSAVTLGWDVEAIVRANSSTSSNLLSSNTETLNEAWVALAGMVTLSGVEL